MPRGLTTLAGYLGMSEITIAALLGHTAASVTGRYIHALYSVLIGAADRVARAIDAQMTGQDEGGTVMPLRLA